MALSESQRVAYGGTKSGSNAQPHGSPSPPEDFLTDLSASSSLGKQSSIFSLTLGEIQLKSGKSVGSMNMDEFLANLWNNVEENQVSSHPNQNQNETINEKLDSANQPTLAHQGSFSIPTPLCKKTVDEVWFELQKDLPQGRKANNISSDQHEPQRQHTFGEMTLEDFLVKAGIVQEQSHSSQQRKVIPPQNNNSSLDANFSMGHVMGSSQQNINLVPPLQHSNVNLDASFALGNVLGMGFPSHQNAGNSFSTANGYATTYPTFPQNRSLFGEPSTNAENGNTAQCLLESVAVQNKRRIIDGPPEVVVERRQRRMIKNRESAARSRARKQAYTVELELELNQLREENEKLKQLLEENEQKRKQEVLKRKQLAPAQKKVVDKLKMVRRTVSLEW
ncbi:hypothetical protein SLA2020_363970 [Shorea laevis]